MTDNWGAFVLIVPPISVEGFDQTVAAFLQEKQCNDWWHWLPDVWIVIDPHGRNTGWWYDEISRVLFQGTRTYFLLMECSGRWCGNLHPEAVKWMMDRFGGHYVALPPPALPVGIGK